MTIFRIELVSTKSRDQKMCPVAKVKGRTHCFLMHVEMYKCFLLNPEKTVGVYPSCRFRQKCKKTHTLIPKNNVTEPKARLL